MGAKHLKLKKLKKKHRHTQTIFFLTLLRLSIIQQQNNKFFRSAVQFTEGTNITVSKKNMNSEREEDSSSFCDACVL